MLFVYCGSSTGIRKGKFSKVTSCDEIFVCTACMYVCMHACIF